MDMKLRLEAPTWTEALRMGRAKVGETEDISANVLCDIKEDNSIHVTDAGTGRVFRIIELSDVPEDEIPTTPPPAEDAKPAPDRKIGRETVVTSEATADFLEEVFELTQEVDGKSNKEEALYYMLDLAMDRVQTDSGSILLADINQYDLYFGAARGPKAEEVKSFRIKMGQGIAGFCADSGVGLAVSDVARDPRFYKAVSETIGYPTKSILCVPMVMEGQVVGVLELINRKENDTFSERDLNISNFIAHHLAEYLNRQR
jgi:putative methionine-R-sulfoxide reductase with GAF domain